MTLHEATHHFQRPRRGMAEYNNVTLCLTRADAEIDEAFDEVNGEDTEALKLEIIDAMLFLTAALVALGVEPEEASRLVAVKHHRNEARYDLDHFNLVGAMIAGQEYSTEDAVARSRHFAKVDNGSSRGNDYD